MDRLQLLEAVLGPRQAKRRGYLHQTEVCVDIRPLLLGRERVPCFSLQLGGAYSVWRSGCRYRRSGAPSEGQEMKYRREKHCEIGLTPVCSALSFGSHVAIFMRKGSGHCVGQMCASQASGTHRGSWVDYRLGCLLTRTTSPHIIASDYAAMAPNWGFRDTY